MISKSSRHVYMFFWIFVYSDPKITENGQYIRILWSEHCSRGHQIDALNSLARVACLIRPLIHLVPICNLFKIWKSFKIDWKPNVTEKEQGGDWDISMKQKFHQLHCITNLQVSWSGEQVYEQLLGVRGSEWYH